MPKKSKKKKKRLTLRELDRHLRDPKVHGKLLALVPDQAEIGARVFTTSSFRGYLIYIDMGRVLDRQEWSIRVSGVTVPICPINSTDVRRGATVVIRR
ncbi:MAG: hypothetical protein AAB408_03900 [Patescibacteria group bacterium]